VIIRKIKAYVYRGFRVQADSTTKLELAGDMLGAEIMVLFKTNRY